MVKNGGDQAMSLGVRQDGREVFQGWLSRCWRANKKMITTKQPTQSEPPGCLALCID